MGCFTCIFHKKQKAKIHSHASKNGVVKDVYEQKNISPDIHKKNGINVSNGYVKQENTVEASPVKEFIKLDTYPKIISPVDESNARISGGVNSEMLFAGTIGSTIGSLSSSRLLATINDDKQAVDEDILKNYDFPFTNLVFEGGGNKGMAYVGALKVCSYFYCYIIIKKCSEKVFSEDFNNFDSKNFELQFIKFNCHIFFTFLFVRFFVATYFYGNTLLGEESLQNLSLQINP